MARRRKRDAIKYFQCFPTCHFEELFGPYLELGHEVFKEKPYSLNTIVANALQEPIEEEIAETESSLDVKEKESDDQEE